MKCRIEILNLVPRMDAKGQISSGLVLSYKKDNGQIESVQLDSSHKAIMEEFKVNNLSDIVGRKFDVDIEQKDGKHKMTQIVAVDDRQVSFTDFSRLENKVNELLSVLKKHISKE